MESLKPRLFLDQPLAEGQSLALDADHARYLFTVMRLGPGDVFAAFNGESGEWRARILEAGRKGGVAVAEVLLRPQRNPPDLWLLFAPIKKARTDFIVEKACELGAARILPVVTERTRSERVRADRLRAHAIEAAEQCGGTFVPEVAEAAALARVLDSWPEDRGLWFCDEDLAETSSEASKNLPGAGAILIGPEGGFSPTERARLRAAAFTKPIRLGPRILRADTAAIAALTLWQSCHGDW